VIRHLIAFSAALLLLLPAAATAGSSSATAGMTRTESALLQQMNTVRARHGLGPLRADIRLERAARSHSREMIQAGVFEHGAFATRMARFSVTGRLAGENLAWGTGARSTARGIIGAWLGSPAHRANLLRGNFTRVGIGDLVGQFLGNPGAHVVTADFAG
jgi:uncharacterized protein YkwD